MKKSIASFVIIFIVFSSFVFSSTDGHGSFVGAATGGSPLTAVPDPVLVEKWKPFDGKKINQLHFSGLKRTLEKSCRWLMTSLEGTQFDSYLFAVDIQTLANTDDLYDITSTVETDPASTDGVILNISVLDKWTLFPVIGGKGGGGAYTYGGGVYDSNLLGTFTQAMVLAYNYNGVFSYEVNVNNEFIAGSQIMGSLDWSNNINPTIIHNIDGSSAGNYSWFRQQEEVMIGTHLPGPARILVIGDYYFDGMVSNVGVNAYTYSGNQYRLHPQIIFGRVNIVDFMEEGQELTFQPMTANPFGPVQPYQGIDIRFKKVYRLPGDSNLAYDIFAGAMSSAPPPYLYEVGGYYNVRGYVDSRQVGPYIVYGNFEYRPFIYKHRFDHVFDVDALVVDKVALQGCLFTDFGSAWGDSALTGDPGAKQFNLLWSVGAGFRVNMMHYAGAIFHFDVARTLRPDEGWGLSFGVGQFF